MTVRDEIIGLRAELRPLYGEREAEAIIREIFLYEKGWDQTQILIHANDALSDYIQQDINKIVERLKRFEPIQYITGRAYFYGMDLAVKPGVLIPRPETQELVQQIVGENPQEDLKVTDVCSGSGCIALALSRNLKFPIINGFDISSTAVEVAQENAKTLRCAVKFSVLDIKDWKPASESLDIVVSNPPYIDEGEKADMEKNVVDYEPATALFVPDNDPLEFYRLIGGKAYPALAEGGKIYFEINPRHKDEVIGLLEKQGYTDVEAWLDSQGKYRFVKGWKRN